MANIFLFLKNLYSSFKYDIHIDTLLLREEIVEVRKMNYNLINRVISLENKILELSKKLKLEEILRYYKFQNESEIKKYQEELDYLWKYNEPKSFPYEQIKYLKEISSGFDVEKNLPYVIHNCKRLYFPENWPEKDCVNVYRNYIENENLLGGDYKSKSPHKYQSNTIFVENGDVLFDVGCAEALFALDVIDKVKKVYLFEVDDMWTLPLCATFEPYQEKVHLIQKYVCDTNAEDSIKLESILNDEKENSIFIKMDIEGNEVSVVNSSFESLSMFNNKLKIACCTYHNMNDADVLQGLFQDLKFDTEFSEGYVLFFSENLSYPYFRKGLIRASN